MNKKTNKYFTVTAIRCAAPYTHAANPVVRVEADLPDVLSSETGFFPGSLFPMEDGEREARFVCKWQESGLSVKKRLKPRSCKTFVMEVTRSANHTVVAKSCDGGVLFPPMWLCVEDFPLEEDQEHGYFVCALTEKKHLIIGREVFLKGDPRV